MGLGESRADGFDLFGGGLEFGHDGSYRQVSTPGVGTFTDVELAAIEAPFKDAGGVGERLGSRPASSLSAPRTPYTSATVPPIMVAWFSCRMASLAALA